MADLRHQNRPKLNKRTSIEFAEQTPKTISLPIPLPPIPMPPIPEARYYDNLTPRTNKIRGKMQNTLVFFGGKPNTDGSMVFSQASVHKSANKESFQTDPNSTAKKAFRMTNSNGWNSSRSVQQEYRFHRASGSIQDKPLATNKIGSSLLGGKVHTSRDILAKPKGSPKLNLVGHHHCLSVQTLPHTDRTNESSLKRSVVQVDRVSDGLNDIFDRLTGQDFRKKMNLVAEAAEQAKSKQASARRIITEPEDEQ